MKLNRKILFLILLIIISGFITNLGCGGGGSGSKSAPKKETTPAVAVTAATTDGGTTTVAESPADTSSGTDQSAQTGPNNQTAVNNSGGNNTNQNTGNENNGTGNDSANQQGETSDDDVTNGENTDDNSGNQQDNNASVNDPYTDFKMLIDINENGTITINDETVTILNINGTTFSLADGVKITVKDSNGNVIPSAINSLGDLAADLGNNCTGVYTVVIEKDGRIYTLTITISSTVDSNGNTVYAITDVEGISMPSGSSMVLDLLDGVVNGGSAGGLLVSESQGLGNESHFVLDDNIKTIVVKDKDGNDVSVSVDPVTGDIIAPNNGNVEGPFVIRIETNDGKVYEITTNSDGTIDTASVTNVLVYTQDGKISEGKTSVTVAVENTNGTWSQALNTEISAADSNGTLYDVKVDPVTGNLLVQGDPSGNVTITIKNEQGTYAVTTGINGMITGVEQTKYEIDLSNGTLPCGTQVLNITVPDDESSNPNDWIIAPNETITFVDVDKNIIEGTVSLDGDNIVFTPNPTAMGVVPVPVSMIVVNSQGVFSFSLNSDGTVSNVVEGVTLPGTLTIDGVSKNVMASNPVFYDANGNVINGKIYDINGNVVFIPDNASDVVAKAVVTIDGIQYTFNIGEDGKGVLNQSGGNSTGGGGNGNGGIITENGSIVFNVNDGKISINGNNITLPQNISDVTISVVGSDGSVIKGHLETNSEGNLVFVPDPSTPLVAGEEYTITVTINGQTYSDKIMVAVDDISKPDSMFAGVKLQKSGSYKISDLMVNGTALFGWDFASTGNKFKITYTKTVKNLVDKVYLTAYGTYNIDGFENYVFYQRWEGSRLPVEDYLWNGGQISIDWTDSSIKSNGIYQNFSKTYLEIKALDKNGNDITATSGIVLNVSKM